MEANINDFKGKTFTKIEGKEKGKELKFIMSDGSYFLMHHIQDCCESVWLEDVVGNLDWLVGSEITLAEEVSSDIDPVLPEFYNESYTWTFYKLATIKGYVDLRWFGESNGYYSESVDIELIIN